MPFVKNCWYAAGWDQEFEAGSITARTLLGRTVAFFRGEDGQVAALLDRCPHRGVPLSMGSIVEGRVRCLYHALEFDAAGTCVHNPHVPSRSSRLPAERIPTATRYGMVWLWHGDAEAADPALVPDYGWFVEPRYATIHGKLHVQADYRLVIDNLMDLSHAEYLHARTVGTPGSSGSVKNSVSAEDARVTVHRRVSDLPPSAVFAPLWKKTPRIDQYADMSWRAPSNLLLDLGIVPPGGERADGFHFPSAHLLTPETERSTHYFYAVARDFATDDAVLSERIRATFVQAFDGEDCPVIEAVQRRIDEAQGGFKFANFTAGDAASAKVRRMLDELAPAA